MQPSGCLLMMFLGPLKMGWFFLRTFVLLTVIGMTFGSIHMGIKVGLERRHLYGISTASALFAIWLFMYLAG